MSFGGKRADERMSESPGRFEFMAFFEMFPFSRSLPSPPLSMLLAMRRVAGTFLCQQRWQQAYFSVIFDDFGPMLELLAE
jgi:hypothetical protein